MVREDSLKLVRDSYVDDIHIGDSQANINRMVRHIDKFEIFTRTIPRHLDSVGLSLKNLVQSGFTNVEANKKLSRCTLS